MCMFWINNGEEDQAHTFHTIVSFYILQIKVASELVSNWILKLEKREINSRRSSSRSLVVCSPILILIPKNFTYLKQIAHIQVCISFSHTLYVCVCCPTEKNKKVEKHNKLTSPFYLLSYNHVQLLGLFSKSHFTFTFGTLPMNNYYSNLLLIWLEKKGCVWF